MNHSAETLAKRRADWARLEKLITTADSQSVRYLSGEEVSELADLYRRACADLAMAEQYHLAPSMVDYLHALVGRAHASLYRSPKVDWQSWWRIAFVDAPRQIYRDPCVQFASLLFFGLFALGCYMALNEQRFPNFAEQMIGTDTMLQLEEMYASNRSRSVDESLIMVAYYIYHNTGIGLRCFGYGILILPGILTTAFNAAHLGAAFGYMARPETIGGENFLHFVTAHGALELSALALAAGGGLRIGVGWINTNGLTRFASLEQNARKAVPIIVVSAILFAMAAFTEGVISTLPVPYAFKVLWLLGSSAGLMFYFVVLGYPKEDDAA